MAGFWSIIVPEATINLLTNPSFEGGTTGWTAGTGHTLAQSSAQSFKGLYSGLVTIGGTGKTLASFAPSGLSVGRTYTLSAWIYVPSAWDGGDININPTGYTGAAPTFVTTWRSGIDPYDTWFYIETRITLASDVTGNIEIGRAGTVNTGKTMYFDAIQMEEKAYPTTYCDGEQPGCIWGSARHLSISSRSAQSREGGKAINLDDIKAYVVEVSGIGTPPQKHNIQEQALIPGAVFVNSKINARTFVLVFDAVGTSREDLHSVRKTLINYVKSDLVKDNQPFIMRYTGALSYKPVEFRAIYSGGAGFGRLDGHTEKIALTLTAFEPFVYEIGDQAKLMGGFQSLASANYIAQKKTGVWSLLGTGLNNEMQCAAIAPNGDLYIGGLFTTANGITVNRIAIWDGSTFRTIGSGPGFNGAVRALLFAPNGDLYIAGAFDDIMGGPGGTYNRICKWNGSTLSTLGTGFNDWCTGLTWGLDGTLYAIGNFTTAGGTTVNRVAKWNGSAWSAMGAGTVGVNLSALCIATATNGDIIIGGNFTTAGGVTVNRIARWNVTSAAWEAIGGGFANNSVGGIIIMPTGEFIVCGDFTGTTGNYLSIWNGVYWRAFPVEPDATVDYIELAPDGSIWAAGYFTSIGDLQTADRLAIWNGSTWSLVDADFPGTPTNFILIWNGAGDLFVGFNVTGTLTTSAAYTVTNRGTRTAYPKIVIKRTGGTSAVVKWIKNETTGKMIAFREYALMDGEQIEIDFTPGARRILSNVNYTWRRLIYGTNTSNILQPLGSVFDALLPNSDLAEFYLLPGDNVISVYILTAGSPTMLVYTTSRIPHWSVDGVAK